MRNWRRIRPALAVCFFASVIAQRCLADEESLIERASIIVEREGTPDPRQTYEEYSSTFRTTFGEKLTEDEVYEKFSATGRLYCGRDKDDGTYLMSSANLVVKNDTAVGVAHAFYDRNCDPIVPDFSLCFFETIVKPPAKAKRYYIRSVNVGTTCPYYSLGTRKDLDWAVIRLQKSVSGARPYRLTEECVLNERWVGINVAAAHDNFGDDDRRPPAVGMCKAREFDVGDGTAKTDCASGGWSSGSGMLCDPKTKDVAPSISGVLVSGQPSSFFDHTPYNSWANFTRAVPLSDGFLLKLRDILREHAR